MILECPNCSTPFNVPKGAIPPDGRRVKCAKCGYKWHAHPSDAVQPLPAKNHNPISDNAAPRPQSPEFLAQKPVDVYESPDDLKQDAAFAARHADLRKDLSAEREGANDDPFLKPEGLFETKDDISRTGTPAVDINDTENTDEPDFMARVRAGLDGSPVSTTDPDNTAGEDDNDDFDFPGTATDIWDNPGGSDPASNTRRWSRKTLYTAGWTSLMVLWLAVFIGFFGFKDQVQTLWPGSSIFYSKLDGFKDTERFRESADSLSTPITDSPRMVEVGLASDVAEPYRWDFKDGQSHLTLTLVVSNKGARAATVPKLLVTFLGMNNDVLKVWTIDPPGKTLTRGSYLDFEISRPDYPVGIKNIVVTELENSVTEGRADTDSLF